MRQQQRLLRLVVVVDVCAHFQILPTQVDRRILAREQVHIDARSQLENLPLLLFHLVLPAFL